MLPLFSSVDGVDPAGVEPASALAPHAAFQDVETFRTLKAPPQATVYRSEEHGCHLLQQAGEGPG